MSKRPCSPSGNSVVTKGELTARRNAIEFFEKRRRHTLLTNSPSFFEAEALFRDRWWKLRIEAYKGSEEWVKFAQSTEDVIRRQEDTIADLEMAIQLQKLVGKATDVLKAGPVTKKQKTEPRKTKGSWGGARRGPGFEAKRASSGTAEQKGAKGELLSK
jgi:hypothetical protein